MSTSQSAQSVAALEKTPTGEQAFQGGAASILSDMLVSTGRLDIQPDGSGTDCTYRSRLSLGAQKLHNRENHSFAAGDQRTCRVTYSRDLTSNKQQIVQIEYFITKNISVLASKDEEDVLALDLRLRKRF